MIVRKRLDLVRLLRSVGPLVAVLLAYDVLLTVLYVVVGWTWVGINDLPLPLLGSAVVLVVTLRNNAAYARWWEGRSLWGAVANNSRSLVRSLNLLVPDRGQHAVLVRLQLAYVVALRCQLLGRAPWVEIAAYVPADVMVGLRRMANVPFGIQAELTRRLVGTADSVSLAAVDRVMSAILDAQGGLERIKRTPLPLQYSHFPMVFSRVYCVLLPVGLLHDLGVLTPVASTVIGVMFLALDRIGRDLQDPFEGTEHDVPMAAIVRGVEIDLLQAVGAEAVPAAAVAVDGVLN